MRRAAVIAVFFLLASGAFRGQQISVPASAPAVKAQPDQVKVVPIEFIPGPGVRNPELIPPNLAPIPPEKCRKKVEGKPVLDFLVDTTGKPQRIRLIQSTGSVLDRIATETVTADRFNPGIHNGAPVEVWQNVEVDLKACLDETKDEVGKKTYRLRLKSQPVQKFGVIPLWPEEIFRSSDMTNSTAPAVSVPGLYRVGGAVSAPVLIRAPEAEFSDQAITARYQGFCLIGLIVDTHGNPQNVHVVKPLGMGLDEKAMEAVREYRFKPAMKDETPVPVAVTVEVNFKLMQDERN